MNKKVLKRKINFLKQPAQNYLFKDNHRRTMKYAKYYEEMKVKKNTILYETRDGNSVTDSPYAMFEYMLHNENFKNYLHIWAIQDFDALSSIISKYKDMANVKFVKRNSDEYLQYLASSEYLINNATFQSFFIAKEEQTYINTWHGTPLKYMGFDIPGNPSHSQNVVRNFLSSDYLLSPNAHTTKIFTESYKLNGLYEGTIIEEGYPRIDLTLNTDYAEYSNYLKGLGLLLDDSKKTILYAPTWKGTSIAKVKNEVAQIIADLNYLDSQVGGQYNLLVKVHPYLYSKAIEYEEIKVRLVPDFVDTNELLAAIDVLVTDYSSIFFDYLVTDKPILFYTWDADAYSVERGMYLENEELPGPMLYNCKELAEAIKNIEAVKADFTEKYKKAKNRFTNYDDGKVTERTVTSIFNKDVSDLNTINCLYPHKEKILIYPGGMRNNGITSSFLNLMDNIDYEKYDVSCFTGTPHSREVINNINKVNPNVRFLFKVGLSVYKVNEVYRDKHINNRGERGRFAEKIYPEAAYEREHARLFGKTKFNYAIDFSGYSLYWAKFLLSSKVDKKICYMHNDLLSDSERVVNGKRPHRVNLRGLFSIYHRFDKLVSVSKGTMELNRTNLLEYADFDKFDYVMNSINPQKILERDAEEQEVESVDENALSLENYKARATIKNVHDYPVWNTLPNSVHATQSNLDLEFENAEIQISRKAYYKNNLLYKFSYQNQVVGWIDSAAVELLPDSIVEEKQVNKIAKLTKPRGNTIWTLPYKVANIEKVSGSSMYKNLVVDVDMQATTERSTYSRISINNHVIGWIDNRALQFLEKCTITEDMNPVEKQKRLLLKTGVKRKNYNQYRARIANIENRTLREINVKKELLALIAEPGDYAVWSKAYPNYRVEKVADAKDYEGQVAKISTINTTIKGKFFHFSIDGEKIGWLDSKAFKVISDTSSSNYKEVWKARKPKLVKDNSLLTQSSKTPTVLLKKAQYDDLKVNEVEKEAFTKTIQSTSNLTSAPMQNVVLVDDNVAPVEVKEVSAFEPNPENVNFVNMGRLSPEKGQDNLIRAFASFHKENEKSALYILGHGPLKASLQALIEELEMESSIFLVGQLENPFPFMEKCDCFVLSSHYEGQPMVLLEAMTLGMKILATDIVANRTVLEDGKYGLLVENSIEGLQQGLESIATNRNNEVYEKFDYLQYNKKAMDTFYSALKNNNN